MAAKRLTQDQKREPIAMLEAGATVKECELKFNITRGAIYQYRSGNYGVVKKPLREQFEEEQGPHTLKENGCWVWQKNSTVRRGSQNHSLLRAAYLELVGEIPSGQVVSTTCKNPMCVNPEHLYLCKQGEALSKATSKMDADKVRAIRAMSAEGKSLSYIGNHFGIKPSAVSLIVNRKRWSNVE